MRKPTKIKLTMDTVIWDSDFNIRGLKVSELAEKYGSFTYRRKTYVYLSEAEEETDSAYWRFISYAVRLGDVIKLADSDVELLDVPVYNIYWYLEPNSHVSAGENFADYVDWDKPGRPYLDIYHYTSTDNPEYKPKDE